jgi:hypothetical protein
MVKAYCTSVPRPDREVEARSTGSGPVKTAKMSPEEMEDYFARIGHKQAASVHVGSKHRSIIEPKAEEVNGVDLEPKKQEIIEMVAKGYSHAKIEEKLGLKKNTFRYQLKKLGLEGLNKDRAMQLLGKIAPQPEDAVVQNAGLADYEKKLAEWDQMNIENMNLQNDLSVSKILGEASDLEIKRLHSRCQELEIELKKWNENDYETQELLLEIMAERDRHQKLATELQVLLAEMTEDRDNWMQTAQQAKQALVELQEEYNKSDPNSTYEALCDLGVIKPVADNLLPGSFEELGLEIGALVADKNAAYGDSFAKTGEFLKLLYPSGIQPHQFKDALCLVRIFDKQMRIATDKDAYGESPYRDIVGYGLLGVMKIS